MKNYLLRKIKNKNAQDMIEFTFVLPVLLAMFVILFTIGQMGFNKQVAFNMVYHACRRSVVADNTMALSQGWEIAKLYTGQLIAVDKANITYQIEVCQITNSSGYMGRGVGNLQRIGSPVSLKLSQYNAGNRGAAVNSNYWKSSSERTFGIGTWHGSTTTTAYFCKSTMIIPTTTLFPMRGWQGSTYDLATSTAMMIEFDPETSYDTSSFGRYSLH